MVYSLLTSFHLPLVDMVYERMECFVDWWMLMPKEILESSGVLDDWLGLLEEVGQAKGDEDEEGQDEEAGMTATPDRGFIHPNVLVSSNPLIKRCTFSHYSCLLPFPFSPYPDGHFICCPGDSEVLGYLSWTSGGGWLVYQGY